METEMTAQVNKVELSENYSLKLQLKAPHFTRSYGVLQSFEKQGKTDTVKYNVDVTFVRTIINRSRIFRLERTSAVYINDTVPDLLADQLADQCGQVFYPLLVEVGFDGSFLAVYNHPEILERWNTRRPELLEYFKGELAEKYLVLMDQVLAEPEQVNEVFRNELFCQVYFASLFKSYLPTAPLEEKMSFSVCCRAAALEFNVAQEVIPELTAVGKIELLHQGKTIDPRSIADLEQEQRFALEAMLNPGTASIKGTYTARYILDPATRSIHSAVAEWMLEMNTAERSSLKVFELEVPAERKQETAKEAAGGMVFLDGRREKKDKKITDIFNFLWK